MDKAGDRWWPIFGAVYLLVGVKRVHGMRLLEPGWKTARVRAPQAVPSASSGRVAPLAEFNGPATTEGKE
jgi:hypothetical protein